MRTITLIGNGTMAMAIAQGLKEAYHLEVVGRDTEKLDTFEAQLGKKIGKHSLNEFDIDGRYVILCVKPANLQEVAKKLSGKAELLISVLAGVPLKAIKKAIKAKHTVRAMPNIAAQKGKSLTTLTGDSKGREKATVLFNAIGRTLWLETEKEIDIATAVAGSGPAYLALVAEALNDGAVKMGLSRENAEAVTQGLFEGFGLLIGEKDPAQLKNEVMSPGGTTAAGYAALETNSARAAFIAAVEAAYQRAEALGN